MTRALALALALTCGAAYADEPAPANALAVGERRALLVQAVDQAIATPEDLVEVACVGPRTVVVTGRQPGEVELKIIAGNREWTMPLTVLGDERPDDAADDARVMPRVTPKIVPVPPPRVASAAGADLAEEDFAPREAVEPPPVLRRSVPRRDAIDDAFHGAAIVRGDAPAGPLPRLTGVLRTAQGPVALLNGAPVGVGERSGEYTVVSVDDDAVVLDCRGRVTTLRLSTR